MNYKYKYAVLGGTFDLLHIGHKNLILKAFKIAKFVSIGITSDRFNKKRGKKTYEDQHTRIIKLKDFLKDKYFGKRFKIIFIHDIFGTTLKDSSIQIIVTTKDTLSNVNLINRERFKKGFQKLQVIRISHAMDKKSKIISSSRIRSGEINPEGEIYKDLLLKIADKKLSHEILSKFKPPLGKIVEKIYPKDFSNIITVGDITTQKVLKLKIQPKLSIIDLKTKRSPLSTHNFIRGSINNRPGQISTNLILKVEKALRNKKSKQVIIVNGEEDLATIPSILLSPFGTVVLYGQPDKGMVKITVNQEIKDIICRFLKIYTHKI